MIKNAFSKWKKKLFSVRKKTLERKSKIYARPFTKSKSTKTFIATLEPLFAHLPLLSGD